MNTYRTEPARTGKSGRARLSRPSVVIAVISLVAGVISGGVAYLGRSPRRQEYVEGTAAIWQHMVVFGLAALVAVVVVRRTHDNPMRLLLRPLGSAAARRLGHTVRSVPRHPTALLRLVLALVPLGMLVFLPFRCGVQILGGLDPNFTVNAWGGPTYLGAMLFHYLDAVLLVAAAAGLLNLLLLRDEN
ncbi:hypothetical protein OHB26_33275 [Nocardia sp. NBC_01503]|uniref:hypothetical protein n=1 Tax=Nocardia sp. NBC_01503 TaxID=2975997 RepID=UPI002E7BE3A1|nr:hypothetical protein [Nocardia sp. NBC_01503]WTL31726.1 hypothetical protein OHB26_33275 [Nocardia sp. NBC_01503]